MNKPTKISGQKARAYVQARKPFTNHNGQLYGKWEGDRYVVYSYGAHWPLFIYDAALRVWFENEDKCSPTTSKHHTQTHPLTSTELRSCRWMRDYTIQTALKAA